MIAIRGTVGRNCEKAGTRIGIYTCSDDSWGWGKLRIEQLRFALQHGRMGKMGEMGEMGELQRTACRGETSDSTKGTRIAHHSCNERSSPGRMMIERMEEDKK